ncbi:MAG: dehydratase [Chloroflexi bacterium]|nr:dehydratase [Chloroflexota bacterium]
MGKQLYYEDVQAGTELPPLRKHPTPRQLVMWAGASGDYYEIHYDKDFASNNGLTGIIVHGRLKVSFLMQMLTDWIGVDGALYKFNVQHRGMDYPGEDLLCKGRVSNKYVKDGRHYVECEVWTENPRGERTAPGTAVVILPAHG